MVPQNNANISKQMFMGGKLGACLKRMGVGAPTSNFLILKY